MNYLISGSGKITAIVNGKQYFVDKTHPGYDVIKKALIKNDENEFLNSLSVKAAFENCSNGKVTFIDGVIYYLDKPIHNAITDRISWMLEEGFDVKPMMKFLENLMQNPSKRAVDELYKWIEHQDIPITDDGCWLGYKYLTSLPKEKYSTFKNLPAGKDIYVDTFSKTIPQWIGHIVEVPRNSVDDNWGVACSQGLHVGSSNYSYDGDVRVIVKVNPADVVTVPSGYTEKCRVCKYQIVSLFEKVYKEPVVKNKYLKDTTTDNAYEDPETDYLGDE